MKKKIIIIGDGIIALATAFELLKKNVCIEVIGCDEENQASKAAVCASTMKGLCLPRNELFKAKMLGHQAMLPWIEEIETAAGINIDRIIGGFEFFNSIEAYQKLRKRIYGFEFAGCFAMRVLNRADLEKTNLNVSNLSNEIIGAFAYPEDLWFDATGLLKALGQAIAKAGGVITKSTVTSLQEYTEKAQTVICATGHRQLSLEPMISKTPSSDNPVDSLIAQTRRVAGHTLWFDVRRDLGRGFACFGKQVIVFNNHQLIVGSSSIELAEQQEYLQPQSLADYRQQVRQQLSTVLSRDLLEVIDTGPVRVAHGIRLRYKDMMPRITVNKLDGSSTKLIEVRGLYKNGYQLAAGIARKVAELD